MFYINTADKFHLRNPQFAAIDLVTPHDAVREVRENARSSEPCTCETITPLHYVMKGESFMSEKTTSYFEKKNLALANVQAKDLQTFYLHEMKTLSGTTVRHEHALLHKILKYAYRMDLIPNNPADKVDPPRAERFEGSAYTEEELALLIEKSWDHKLGLLIYITVLLGLRRSEVLGLRWKAIDFEENRITINHTVTEARVDGKTVIIASAPRPSRATEAFPCPTRYAKSYLLGVRCKSGTARSAATATT